MKFVQTASRWGNLYNIHHFIDGKRVSRYWFNYMFDKCELSDKFHETENTDYGYRMIWEN